MINLKTVKNIQRFDSTFDVLENYGNGEKNSTIKNMNFNEDEILFLRHCDDWESFEYLVFNDKYIMVVDSCNGDAISPVITLKEFWQETMEYMENNID